MDLLSGKVAIVTGAGRGIGRAEALLLASEGARVVVNDMGGGWDGAGSDARPAAEVVAEIHAAGGDAIANFSDVATQKGADELVEQALEEFGDLDVLVNNAGILRDGMIFSIDPEEWRKVLDVHLMGHFLPTRRAGIYWRQRAKELGTDLPHRAVINTTSESGLFGNAGQSNYDTAKLGIVSLTIAAAKELAKYQVSVNAIAPRARTRLTTTTFEGSMREGEFAERDPDAFDAMNPDNIAPFVAYLATDGASHVTGQTFVVYGGIVGRVRLPHLDSFIVNNGRWSVDELSSRVDELFKDIGSGHFEGPRGYARLPKQ